MKFISCTFLFLCLIFVSIRAYSQFTHAGRGMYVNKFFRTSVNSSGTAIVDPNRSILSIAAKEDSLLKYCRENHFTYIVLYDLYYVFGNPVYESYLCAFMQKARTQYCIEKIGVASSCSSMFDNVAEINPTPALFLPTTFDATFRNKLDIVTRALSPADSLFYVSEVAKLGVRTSLFNNSCAYKFDVLVSEYEFWNTATDDCVGDNPTKDQKYERYQELIGYMDAIRDYYNATHTHQLYVETYLGYLNQNTIYSHQTIADWIDGSYNGLRRADRINPHYYGSDAAKLYSRTTTGWNNAGYYLTRFLDFCQATTTNQTYVHPIFSSEYTYWGAGSTFLGQWFTQHVNNNIFTAEKKFYDDWYDDAQNYSPTTVGSPVLGNVVHPGGVQWFTSQQLVGHLNNPVLFTSNSPVCAAQGQSGNLQFQYQGPIEQGVSFKFYLTDAGGTTLQCGKDSAISWPPYDPVTQTSLDLNAALGSCSLPAGNYDAHLVLEYSAACNICLEPCSIYTAPPVRVSVGGSGNIVALTPTTLCQGHAVYLKASSTEGGSTAYAWYDGNSPISGATASTYAVNPATTGTHNYSCKITSSDPACSANRSNNIPVTVNAYPAASISVLSSTQCAVVLKANPSASTYIWQDGSTGSTFTAGYGGVYSVTATKNGCAATASYSVQKVSVQNKGQEKACGNTATGSVTVNPYWGTSPYTIGWSGPVNGSFSGVPSGNKTINNLYPGTYTITVTDASGCSRTLSPDPVIGFDTSSTWYYDADGDGYGNILMKLEACSKPPGYITDSTDCNDSEFNAHPGATEVCNGMDDNCDGAIDEGCNTPLTLNLKVFIQGYYVSDDTMTAVIDSVNYPLLCDTLVAELHNASSPFQTLYEDISVIDIAGNAGFYFPQVYKNRYYYIVVKHRNALETWSNDSVYTYGSVLNFDFTTAANKAYGNNLVSLGDGNYAIWSGDVTDDSGSMIQDGRINASDYNTLIGAASGFASGYSVFDLTGNGLVESSDFSVMENNFLLQVSASRP